MSSSVIFASNQTTTKYADDELALYLDAHLTWVSTVQRDDGVLYCFNAPHIDSSLQLFRLDQAAQAAERELAELCDRHDAVGICNSGFIRYPLLRPPLPWPPKEDLSDFLDLGWTEKDIRQVQTMPHPTAKLHHRLRGAAGRLISMPGFLMARDGIRRKWDALPPRNRPQLHIARSRKAAPLAHLDAEPARDDVAAFFNSFDKFCDEWQLLGITTWELPDVAGPLLAPALAPPQSLQRGELTIRAPWHFTIIGEDGLGRVLQEEHQRRADLQGIKDRDSWETYARLLEVYHWQNVFRGRYERPRQVKGFITKLVGVISGILRLDQERVLTLQKWLSALQKGKRATLRGRR